MAGPRRRRGPASARRARAATIVQASRTQAAADDRAAGAGPSARGAPRRPRPGSGCRSRPRRASASRRTTPPGGPRSAPRRGSRGPGPRSARGRPSAPAQPGGRDQARRRCVATDAHDDAGPEAAQTRAARHRSPRRVQHVARRSRAAPGAPASAGCRRAAGVDHEARRRHRRASRPRCAPTNRIASPRWPRRRAPRRARGPGTHGRPCRLRSRPLHGPSAPVTPRPWRAMFTRMPAPASWSTSADPPNDTNGSGTPVTGSTPTTAPMLITAWPTTHTVAPAASNAPNRSGARRPRCALRAHRTRRTGSSRASTR